MKSALALAGVLVAAFIGSQAANAACSVRSRGAVPSFLRCGMYSMTAGCGASTSAGSQTRADSRTPSRIGIHTLRRTRTGWLMRSNVPSGRRTGLASLTHSGFSFPSGEYQRTEDGNPVQGT